MRKSSPTCFQGIFYLTCCAALLSGCSVLKPVAGKRPEGPPISAKPHITAGTTSDAPESDTVLRPDEFPEPAELPRAPAAVCIPKVSRIPVLSLDSFFACLEVLKEERKYDAALNELTQLLESSPSLSDYLKLLLLQSEIGGLSGREILSGSPWQDILEHKSELDLIVREAERKERQQGSPENNVNMLVEELNRTYLEGGHYKEISRKALILLRKVKAPEVRTEIKNIVSASWQRDETQVAELIPRLKSEFQLHGDKSRSRSAIDSLKNTYPPQKGAEFDSLLAWIENSDTGPKSALPDSTLLRADSLLSRGLYTAVIPVLEKLAQSGYTNEARVRMNEAGNLFCTEKRKSASVLFKNSRQQKAKQEKTRLLTSAAAELDSCLALFPEANVAGKVGMNKNLIQKQLDELNADKNGVK